MEYNTELGFKASGTLDLRERLGKEAPFDAADLIDTELDEEMELRLVYSMDPDITEQLGFQLALGAHHIENPDTGRVFHGNLRIYLNRWHIEQMRNFCDLILKMSEGEAT